jgi:predicted glutamine amidotransferase
MCGLVGMIYNTQNGCIGNESQAFEEMLYFDAVRGEDSTGVAAFYNDGELQVIKDAIDANSFLYQKDFHTLKYDLVKRGKAVMGHNRKKTVGKIDATTAHPFVIDNRYAFMHNGTLSSHKHLADVEVDSEALGIHLTKCEGDKEKLEQALSNVWGAYACVWIDQKKERLYLLRNVDRPLFYAKTDNGIVFGSEYMLVVAACFRNRVKVETMETVEVDKLYSFDLSKQGAEMHMEELSIKKATPPTHKTNGHGGHGKGKNAGKPSVIPLFSGEVSKNAYKRFRNNILGTTLMFWMEDYVERHYPAVDGDWLVFGTSDSIEPKHMISGYLDGVTYQRLQLEYLNRQAYGVISRVDYDNKTRQLKIHLDNIQNVPPSIPKKESVCH